jgi:hypothetical protein
MEAITDTPRRVTLRRIGPPRGTPFGWVWICGQGLSRLRRPSAFPKLFGAEI